MEHYVHTMQINSDIGVWYLHTFNVYNVTCIVHNTHTAYVSIPLKYLIFIVFVNVYWTSNCNYIDRHPSELTSSHYHVRIHSFPVRHLHSPTHCLNLEIAAPSIKVTLRAFLGSLDPFLERIWLIRLTWIECNCHSITHLDAYVHRRTYMFDNICDNT